MGQFIDRIVDQVQGVASRHLDLHEFSVKCIVDMRANLTVSICILRDGRGFGILDGMHNCEWCGDETSLEKHLLAMLARIDRFISLLPGVAR